VSEAERKKSLIVREGVRRRIKEKKPRKWGGLVKMAPDPIKINLKIILNSSL
jgi:hypothetical protein